MNNPQSNGKPIRIIHVEDLPSDVALVDRELKRGHIQFEKLVVDNRADFEDALREYAPDIVLSDHSLPAFGSKEALKLLHESGLKVPFILVTATVSEEFAVQMMKEGIADYIVKDRLQRLPKAVLFALERAKAQQERENYHEEIRRMNRELERKVEERTLILQQALAELEHSRIELSQALNKEKDLNEIKSRFLSMASHEFRTPLSTILSSATLISKYVAGEDQVKRAKHIQRIKDSVRNLNSLLEDFLNLGKIDAGRVEITAVNIQLQEFIADLFEEISAMLRPGQVLQQTYSGDAFFVTDKALLKNILLNLLSNAIKFSGEHQPIDVSVRNTRTEIVIEICDRGVGIAPEDFSHLYSTFYRGKNVVNIQGTGLGLHIVKRYLDMLQGDIDFASTLNEGTRFTIRLPALTVQEP